jgi:hypothetical protein
MSRVANALIRGKNGNAARWLEPTSRRVLIHLAGANRTSGAIASLLLRNAPEPVKPEVCSWVRYPVGPP